MNSPKDRSSKTRKGNNLLIFLLATAGFTLAAYFFLWEGGKKAFYTTDQQETGTPLIGGSFTLTNQRGEKVSDQAFRGKYMLVYFGFTRCPDVCPTDMLSITQAMEKLGEQASEVQPIFITIDPERDTPEQLASYVANFTPSLQALTGTKEEIQAVVDHYKVYATKAEPQETDEYSMNHSAFTYLMDREGKYLTHFAHDTAPEVMAEGISKYLGQ